jgi:hypothetical protein
VGHHNILQEQKLRKNPKKTKRYPGNMPKVGTGQLVSSFLTKKENEYNKPEKM